MRTDLASDGVLALGVEGRAHAEGPRQRLAQQRQRGAAAAPRLAVIKTRPSLVHEAEHLATAFTGIEGHVVNFLGIDDLTIAVDQRVEQDTEAVTG